MPNRFQLIFYRKGGVRNKNSEVTLLINHRLGKNINRWIVEGGVGYQVGKNICHAQGQE